MRPRLGDPQFVVVVRDDDAGRPGELVRAHLGVFQTAVAGDQATRRRPILHQIWQPILGRVGARSVGRVDRAVRSDGRPTSDRRSARRAPNSSLPTVSPAADSATRPCLETHAIRRPSPVQARPPTGVEKRANAARSPKSVARATNDRVTAGDVERAVRSEREVVGTFDLLTELLALIEPLIGRERAVEHRDDVDLPVGK